MKKLFTLSTLALLTILLLSNFSSPKKHSGQFIFMSLEDEPILPATPYPYRDIEFPDHIRPEPNFDLGYGRGEVDTTFVQDLNNDVATLGRVLFYDKKLSALENISCASCHKQEKSFADDVALSEGVNSNTRRNSMQLNDLGWTDNEHFFWDMSESNFSEMIRLPLKDENEIGADMDEIAIKLGNTSYYPDLFMKAFNSDAIDEEKIVEALVQFMKSMTTFNTKFDQSADDFFENFSEEELFGLELFSFACGECHIEGSKASVFGLDPDSDESVFAFAPFLFNNGLPLDENDLGVGEWNEDGLDHLFKAPTLRNIELTGPYMHDGSIETLEGVIEFYSEESQANEWSFLIPDGGYRFLEEEKSALLAFLKTLTDQSFIEDVKFSDPFDATNGLNGSSYEVFGDFVIKPNPMGDFSTIEFSAYADTETELKIVNGVGQLILKETIVGNNYRINKQDFSSGIYYLHFKRGNQQSTQKLIVQ